MVFVGYVRPLIWGWMRLFMVELPHDGYFLTSLTLDIKSVFSISWSSFFISDFANISYNDFFNVIFLYCHFFTLANIKL